jgi:acetoin utilization deacetylase AcuC-like enzyme
VLAPLAQQSDVERIHTQEHLAKLELFCNRATEIDAAVFPFYKDVQCSDSSSDSDSDSDDSRSSSNGGGLDREHADEDFYFTPGTMDAMRYAAGGAVEAVDRLFLPTAAIAAVAGDGATSNHTGAERAAVPSSFAIVRPPGHHCCGKTAAGFCLLNNTATAAAHAREVLGLERVRLFGCSAGCPLMHGLVLRRSSLVAQCEWERERDGNGNCNVDLQVMSHPFKPTLVARIGTTVEALHG